MGLYKAMTQKETEQFLLDGLKIIPDIENKPWYQPFPNSKWTVEQLMTEIQDICAITIMVSDDGYVDIIPQDDVCWSQTLITLIHNTTQHYLINLLWKEDTNNGNNA